MKIDRTEPQIIAYNPDYYSAFPDVVYFNGEFLCAYRESDTHHPNWSKIVLLKSKDALNWMREELLSASLEVDGFVFNCPRLNVVDRKLVLICDTKTSQTEAGSSWKILQWKFKENQWTDAQDLLINGMVPDKIIVCGHRWLMGYHFVENKKLVQMVAISYDQGKSWRDRITIAISDRNDFCEGSIVHIEKNVLLCYMRDNRGPRLRAWTSLSINGGLTWNNPTRLDFAGHRIVAQQKKKEPYKGLIIGTFRNTLDNNISLFLHNIRRSKIQITHIDHESRESLYDFGYTSWAETDSGTILLVYYIQRHYQNPMICSVLVKLT